MNRTPADPGALIIGIHAHQPDITNHHARLIVRDPHMPTQEAEMSNWATAAPDDPRLRNRERIKTLLDELGEPAP